MTAVWLAAFRDGVVRLNRSVDDGRPRMVVPPLLVVRNLLRELGGPGLETSVLKSLCPASSQARSAYEHCGIEQSAGFALPIVALVKIDSEGFCPD
jgi:hypothetical protein